MSDANIRPFTPRAAKSRGFIADAPLRPGTRHGKQGVHISVRLTSYRSLPLSCIESIRLRLDGRDIDPASLELLIDGGAYRLRDMPRLADVWWFILDYAELFAPVGNELRPGAHEVEGTLVTVEPYMTAGRFSFHNSSTRTLRLDAEMSGSAM